MVDTRDRPAIISERVAASTSSASSSSSGRGGRPLFPRWQGAIRFAAVAFAAVGGVYSVFNIPEVDKYGHEHVYTGVIRWSKAKRDAFLGVDEEMERQRKAAIRSSRAEE